MINYFIQNKKIIHHLVCIFFMFFFQLIPPSAPLTTKGMAMVGIFIGTVYGWTTIGMLWPSMLSMVAMILVLDATTVLAVTFGNSVIMMMIVMLVLMEFLNSTNTTELLAVAFLTSKINKGRPWVLITLFFIGAWACAIINPIVTLMMFMGFIAQICRTVKIPLRSKFTSLLAIGIGLAALMGQSTLPFYSAGLTYIVTYSSMFQDVIPNVSWMAFFILVGLLTVFCYIIVMRFIFRLDVSALRNLDTAMFGERRKLTAEQKIAVSGFAAFIIMVLVASFISAETVLGYFLTKITNFGQILLIIGVLMLLANKEGKAIFDFRSNAAKGISWDVVFMVAVIMALAQFLTGADTGVTALIGIMLQPLTGLPPIAFIILALVLAIILTNFANNFVVALVIMPAIYTFCAQVGLSPMGPVMTLFVSTQIAIGTPGASFPIGICYSFSDIVDAPQMMKYAWITVVFLTIMCLAIALPLSLLMF